MPHVLTDEQHEICDVFGNGGVVFGTELTGVLTLSPPVITASDIRTSDTDRPQEDGVMFGRDYRGAKVLTFDCGVLAPRGASEPYKWARDTLNAIENIWTAEKWRQDPRAMAMLRTCVEDEVWRCYGRPRRYDETAGPLSKQGYVPVQFEFNLIDEAWYSDILQSFDLALRSDYAEGGLVAPIVAPITTTPTSGSEGAVMTVGGTRATWPIVDFHGPVTNPQVTIGDLTIGLNSILGLNEVVTFDPRPWKRTVVRDTDSASVAGDVNAATPVMRKCKVTPGSYEVQYQGQDPTGTSYVTVSWRDARTRP